MSDRSGLIDRAVDQLRKHIISGDWPVGSKIPTEPALTELLGVGRNTVREAVQSLVHAGLLARRQGSGTYVLSDSELTVVMGRQIADANHQHVLEVRRSLEVEAARLAARRRTDEDIAALRGLNTARQAAFAGGDIDEIVAADLALHRAIAATARNPVLLSLYENLIDAIGANIRTNVIGLVHTQSEDDHDSLVESIALGDSYLAMEEITSYLDAYIDDPLA
ncbi:transcriptional regulator, GntR family [Sanguibacter gelidistatuariae]|uniref:Transcriptional regulator, GntR family n=1 Tax=Sanguibacter gelidistatuariae TaxID=1814289 RepID=A0A1G6VNB6_9MICO|nr:FadR/GntR family transcriptional regulator [Sanguibacter gelidistatuariae]SDD55092.1 transcriptional regulator, GntR family [Sanguibacter gelidistatuariae]